MAESTLTVRQVAERIVELGLVDLETAHYALDSATLDRTLDYFGEPDGRAVLRLLDRFRIWYAVDYKSFRGVCEDGLELYESELREIEDRMRGLVDITDIEVVDEADGEDEFHVLRFRCDGNAHEWRIAHDEDEDEEEFDAVMEFALRVHDLKPTDSPARWCGVEIDDASFGPQAVFGDPEALRQLGAEFGLVFRP